MLHMDVIMIHGPPAAGKFTVAKELEIITGYKLIHIHSIYDFLEDIFTKYKYEISLEILHKIYLNILEETAKLKFKGIIFTYAEIARDDFKFIKEVKKLLDIYKCKLMAVQLFCKKEELKKRVISESRKQFKKTQTLEELEYLLSLKDYESSFEEVETFCIDNTNMTPKEAAEKIKEYFSI